MVRMTLARRQRVRTKGQYAFVRRHGKEISDECLAQCAWTHGSLARVGVVVSKAFGSAVRRNAFKRRVREAFRRSTIRECVGLDVVVRPQGTKMMSWVSCCRLFDHVQCIMSGVQRPRGKEVGSSDT